MPVLLQAGLSLLGPSLVASRLAVTTLAGLKSSEIPRLEPLTEFSTPNETVTIVINRAKGVMDIFTEHDPHPLDWDIACDMIRKLCDPDDIGEPDYLKGVDTFRVQLKH